MINRKSLIVILFSVVFSVKGYSQDMKNWFNEDPNKDRYAGISSDRTYDELLKGKTSYPVIVAVIDGGTDVTHPDLKENIWVNKLEIPGNGVDDDKNGYADDLNGWNFIGGEKGDVNADNLEIVRIYKSLKKQYENADASSLSKSQKEEYKTYLSAKKEIDQNLAQAEANLVVYERLKNHLEDIRLEMGGDDFTAEELLKNTGGDEEHNQVKLAVASAMNNDFDFKKVEADIMEGYHYFYDRVKYNYNVDFDPRYIVNDNYEDFSERIYGNSNVTGPDALHGTHVAGIIGAVRNNDIGMNGVAADVRLMIIRTIPNGDERDKDVANAIRYAVDNGAKVINMSFGKDHSPGKKYVDDAVKYAIANDVLMVHAAGNDNSNNDRKVNYPSPYFEGTDERIPGWIEVGAISSSGDIADFSNYGARSVDVFAPGVTIYSTMPGGVYDFQNGTSMAAPVVSGLAAMIRSYYPSLSAEEVKKLIMESVIKPKSKTRIPGTKKKKAKFSKLCVSAGWVNAYSVFSILDKLSAL